MTNNQISIAALALDLKRVALGYHNRSFKTANRFAQEALKRKEEINEKEVKPYLKEVLKKLPKVLSQKDKRKLAEDALMYSTIFQNYAFKFK
jgi:polysaccharide pyruvyl transferase WcaK-like protein